MPRTIGKDQRHIPFCWQEKKALRRIEKYYEANPETKPSKPFTFSVYLALTWMCSDAAEDTLEKAVKQTAEKSGCSERTTRYALNILFKLKLISIQKQYDEQSKSYTPSLYELLSTDAVPPPASDAVPPPAPDTERIEEIKNKDRRNKEGYSDSKLRSIGVNSPQSSPSSYSPFSSKLGQWQKEYWEDQHPWHLKGERLHEAKECPLCKGGH